MNLIYKGETKFAIPTNINEINDEAFYFSELKEIIIPGNVKKIGARAFSFSVHLKKAIIENGVEEIGESAFENCDSLEEVVIPESVRVIKANAFFSCEKLKKINLPKGLEKLCDGLFFGCEGLEKIIIPSAVKEIEENVFFDCESLKTVSLPCGITKIPAGLFVNCKKLENAAIPETVKEIDLSAFASCQSITEINVPKNAKFVVSVQRYSDAVDKCINLKAINIDPENPYYSSIDGIVYSKDGSTLLGCPMAVKGEFTVPEKVTAIGPYAFFQTNIEKINIGKKVKEIGKKAFGNCPCLKEISVEKENKNYSSAEGVLFDKEQKILLAYPNMKEGEIYSLPDTVTVLEEKFTGSPNLKKIILGTGLETIKGNFDMCRNLKEIEVREENMFFSAKEGVLFSKDMTELVQYPQAKEDESYLLPPTVSKMTAAAFMGTNSLKEFRVSKQALTKALTFRAAKL